MLKQPNDSGFRWKVIGNRFYTIERGISTRRNIKLLDTFLLVGSI